jgi:H+/Cl- antiporter ClcA
VVFAVVTLFVLGWFRYEAYKTDKMKEGINKAIKNLNNQVFDPLNPTAPPPPAVQAQIEAKMRSFDALNQDLVNSPWALASFVLSGVLFALAGDLFGNCLSCVAVLLVSLATNRPTT